MVRHHPYESFTVELDSPRLVRRGTYTVKIRGNIGANHEFDRHHRSCEVNARLLVPDAIAGIASH